MYNADKNMKNYTTTCTGTNFSPIGHYRVDRISANEPMRLEDFCNGYLKEKGYKPVSISEIYEGVPTKDFQRWTILSKKKNFLEKLLKI